METITYREKIDYYLEKNRIEGHPATDKERIKKLNPLKCVECGLCTYSCTSKIPVTDYIRKAKVIAKLW